MRMNFCLRSRPRTWAASASIAAASVASLGCSAQTGAWFARR